MTNVMLRHFLEQFPAREWRRSAIIGAAAAGLLAMGAPAFAAGTTLAAVKTIDICTQSDGQWKYSGEIAVWNSGAVDTQGFQIYDHIQNKISGPTWTDQYHQTLGVGDVIPAGTTQLTALTYIYNIVGAALPGDVRNVADVTILNHAGHITVPPTPFGPSPKATYTGPQPPPSCASGASGCTYTRGYWGSKPGGMARPLRQVGAFLL